MIQVHDPDDRYVRIAVLIMLSLALFGGLCATAIHWMAPVRRPMDLIVPPLMSGLCAGLIVMAFLRPDRILFIARTALVAASLAFAAPTWLYTVQAFSTPGLMLTGILPPLSSLFVVYLVMLMVFVSGRRAFLLAALSWILIALPVLAYLLLHPRELWAPRGADLLMAYGPVSIMVVVILPVQRGLVGKIRRLSLERNRMEAMLHHDPLTGTQSRLRGERVLHEMLREHVRAGVIMFDLDRFKAINDTYGHPVGDRVLQAVAAGCMALLREDECIARWGGEEFLVIVPRVDADALLRVAERMRAAVAARRVAPAGQVTASFGAAMIHPGDTAGSVLQRADLALYRAKELGGNCVTVAPEPAAGGSQTA